MFELYFGRLHSAEDDQRHQLDDRVTGGGGEEEEEEEEEELEGDVGDDSSSEISSDVSWVAWFISQKGSEFFCEIDHDYLNDDFNLTGLNSLVGK